MSHRHLNHNSPYLYVRLKRTQRDDSNAPVWVSHKFDGRWHKVKKCKNQNEAIDLLCLIAKRITPHVPQ
jgi:hypothetical protein